MDKLEIARLMESTGWLSRRPAAFREELLMRCRFRRFAAGQSLYNADDQPGGMWGLIDGRLLIRVPPSDTIISAQAPGFWTGEATAFRRAHRMVSITAATKVEVLHLSQADFDAMAEDAENCRHFAINTAEALGEAVTVVANLTQPDSEIRVAQRLLTFMGLYGEMRRRALSVSQSEMATMCGLSRQTMGKVLAGLVERRIIAIGYRRIDILDVDRLRALAIDDERIWH
jgi:CRP-like cAMP-binding protein